MKVRGIRIVNNAEHKQVERGTYTQIFAVYEDEDGSLQEFEISSAVRGVEATIKVGEIITARLDCFVTGIETRAEVESVILHHIKPRKRSLWRRVRDISTVGSPPTGEYVR